MNNRLHNSNGDGQHNEEAAALLTAYALNQLCESERAAVEARLSTDSAAQAYVRDMQRLSGVVEEALVGEECPPVSTRLRKRLDEKLDVAETTPVAAAVAAGSPPRSRWRWVTTAAALALSACLLAALMVPAVQSSRDAARRTQARNNLWQLKESIEAAESQSVTTVKEYRYDSQVARPDNFDSTPYSLSPPKVSQGNGQQAAESRPLATEAEELRVYREQLLIDRMSPGAAPEPARVTQLRRDQLIAQIRNPHPTNDGEGRLPNEPGNALFGVDPSSNAEQYDQILENPFLGSRDFPLSTFSIDVDTASYANVRRFLTGGSLPPPDAVRIEELINYFTYDDPQPQGNAPFSVNMEVAECPWTPGHHLLRVGLKGREIASDKRPNSNLVFLLDVSGSMQAPNKLPLVKQAMGLLVRELSENDMVTIVTYAGSEGVALETTSGDRQAEILKAIESLNASGSTHASAGITLAYELARKCFIKEGANRVILCTDGDFNVGITNDDALVDLITTQAKGGVFLSVLGFGMGNLKDAKMEKLADHGNGNYGYIDTLREARKVLVEQMSGTLVAIAKDVKIQIEFNPATVVAYRQIGYENRVLAAKDFDDDTKDAGEIGAGHSVTALYEIVLAGHEKAVGPDQVPLKYQQRATSPATDPAEDRELTEAAASGELMTVKLRFKEPLGDKSELIEFPLKQEPKKFGAASENLRFASAVASFGMLLRGSEYRGGATMSAVSEIATASLGSDPSGYRAEFLDLVRRAQQLGK